MRSDINSKTPNIVISHKKFSIDVANKTFCVLIMSKFSRLVWSLEGAKWLLSDKVSQHRKKCDFK